jgi:hypothetical protein
MEAGGASPPRLDAASRAYGYVLASRAVDSGSAASAAAEEDAWAHAVMSREFGATSRLLWEQRTFTAQLESLEGALQVSGA